MTFLIGSTAPRSQYVASAAQTVFSVPFEWRLNSDLVVRVNDVLKTLNTDYTLVGAGVSGGGTCTFVAAMAGGETVVIYGNMPVERGSEEYSTGGQLPATVLEGSLDDATLRMKQLARDIDRTLHLTPGDSSSVGAFALPNVATRKGKYGFFFNATTGLPELFSSLGATALSRSIIGGYLNPQTQAEVNVGVTPADTGFPVGNASRYSSLADAVLATRDDSLFLDATVRAVTAELSISKRTVIVGSGCDTGVTIGSILSSTASNIIVLDVDGTPGGSDAQRTKIADIGIVHQGATQPAIRFHKAAAYGQVDNVVIKCNLLGHTGLQFGDQLTTTAGEAWQCTANNVRVDDAVNAGIRVNTT